MRRLKDDSGATAVLVALVMLMLLGFAAFAVDVAALYQEKRELQNGADAAAMAAAADCGREWLESSYVTCNEASLDPIADEYANHNANDGDSLGDIIEVNTGESPPYLTAQATTVDGSNGNGFLTHWFAWAINNPQSTVLAQAKAAWGATGGTLGTLPLTFSQCEWDRFTSSGTNYASEPFDPASADYIDFHDGNSTEPCHSSSSGQDIPGGFGWLETDGSSCQVALNSENWVYEDPGSSASTGCDAATVQSMLGKTILIPIFDDATGLGSNGQYHIMGFAAFHLTSYRLGGSPEWNQTLPGYTNCRDDPDRPSPAAGDVRCVGGHFTTFVDVGGTIDPDAPPMGAVTIQLIG